MEALFLTLKKKTGVSVGALRKDWARYRATRDAQAREEEAPPITPEAREAARELSEDPALLHRAIRTIGELGVVGEEENRGFSTWPYFPPGRKPPSASWSRGVPPRGSLSW